MLVPISPRLLACAEFVKNGARVADIGCDHGYLSIYLLTNGIAQGAIAADINAGPLDSARRNAQKYGVADKMCFCLSNGVANVPRDFDTLVCAGMGGITMISILEAAPWLKNGQYRLILQCQSKTPALRQYLFENGWQIVRERILRDGRFLYTVMEVCWQAVSSPMTAGEFYFPQALFENPAPVVEEYHRQVVKKLRIRVAGHGENADPQEKNALAYLESLTCLKEENP